MECITGVIEQQLKEVAETHHVAILYASESGSRVYGIESTSSDYDVKFIYVHKLDYYLSLEAQGDTIRKTHTHIHTHVDTNTINTANTIIDMSGWELRKALILCKKSNASLLEWTLSPIVYVKDDSFVQRLREIMFKHYNRKSLVFHWRSLAQHNIKSYINVHDVKYKQYLYVIRPLLCISWIIEHHGNQTEETLSLGAPPPLELECLVNEVQLSHPVKETILSLIARKRLESDLGEGRHLYELEKWFGQVIEKDSLSFCGEKQRLSENQEMGILLDKLLLDTVKAFADL